MRRRSTLGYLLALLAVAGLMLAPLVHGTMAMGTAGHAMPMAAATTAGAEIAGMADMPCCPHKAPVPDCGNDCPFMALCSAMPFGVPLAGLIVPLTQAGTLSPGDQSGLVGVARAPPRRPPKHPGSSAVTA
jgi:hypothetical protein